MATGARPRAGVGVQGGRRAVRRGVRAAALSAALATGLGAASPVACGYQTLSLRHPFGARAVAVVPFVETPAVGIRDLCAARLADALRAGGARVVTDVAEADALLEGTLRVVGRPGTTLQAVQIYHVDGVLDASWRDAAGAVVWRGQAGATESYLPQGTPGVRQPAATETQRRMALQRLAERLAQQLEQALSVAQLSAPPTSGGAAPSASPSDDRGDGP